MTTTSPAGIVAERAMYLSRRGAAVRRQDTRPAGVAAPAPRWFLAEGATGPLFDEFVLLANPTTAAP